MSHDEAIRSVSTLLTERQCYAYALDLSPDFEVDPNTRRVTTLTSQDYVYDENKLLQTMNVGSFGFGVEIPMGSTDEAFTPANYDYTNDRLDLRWKHVD